jgi:aspartate aminotransferase
MTIETIQSVISERGANIKDSITMATSALANAMKKEGKDVLSFSAGEPDFDTPDSIKNAGIRAIQNGKTKYTPASGIIELKQAICEKLKRDQGLDYGVENIVVSCGAKHSIFNTLMALLNEGDEVIIPAPFWVSYPDQVEIAGGKPVVVDTTEQNNFKVTPESLKSAITPRSKCLILNSPSNPTGSVYTKEELEALVPVILDNNLIVISDEIYEKLIYDGESHISILSLSEKIKNQAIIVNGVSKAYSMTGWRIGYVAAPAQIAKVIGKLQSQSTSNPSSPSQWASVEAVTNGDKEIPPMKTEFDARRRVMVEELNKIDGITCLTPKGAFYAFPNISGCFGKSAKSGTINSSIDFCNALLKEALVACVPGAGFGADNNVRLSYATSLDDIEKGIKRIRDFVNSLN